MSLPFPPNVTVTVYRGFDAAAPLPSPERAAALRGLAGHLASDLKEGRMGEGQALFWTHVLFVDARPETADVRDPYGADISVGDTVVIADHPNPGCCCPFVVRFVQRLGFGPSSCLAALLDRCLPAVGPCDGVRTPCCSEKLGVRLTAELANGLNCPCFTGTVSLDYQRETGKWQGMRTVCGKALTLKFWCQTPGGLCNFFRLGGSWAGCTSSLSEAGMAPTALPPCTCSPLSVTFRIDTAADCCGTGASGFVTVTVRQ